MYRRRMFYDITSGNALRSYAARGDIRPAYTPEQEAADVGLTNWGVFAWDEPDGEIDAEFAPYDEAGNPRAVSVAADVEKTPHALVFAYGGPEAPLEAQAGEEGSP